MNYLKDMILKMRENSKIQKQIENEKLIALYNSDNVVEALFNHFQKKIEKLIKKNSRKLCDEYNIVAIAVIITKLQVNIKNQNIIPKIEFTKKGLEILDNSDLNHINKNTMYWDFNYFYESNYLPKECWTKLVEKLKNAGYSVRVLINEESTNCMTIIMQL